MKNLKNFKTFEAEQIGTFLATSKEDLTNYYKCNQCNALFKSFNSQSDTCPYCNSNDIVQISDFEYMTSVKDKDGSEYEKEMKDKSKRGSQHVDLVSLARYEEEQRRKKSYN